ncbi:MAG: S8 family serine peptidase [Phaeodactylibacter sp.]|nr:S8 family serine peptidase [Phaeodactylibacter sp.]
MAFRLKYRHLGIVLLLFGPMALGAQLDSIMGERHFEQGAPEPPGFEWKLSPHFSPKWDEKDVDKKELILIKSTGLAVLLEHLQYNSLTGRIKQQYPEVSAILLWLSPDEVKRLILPLEEVVFVDRRNGLPKEERAVRGFDLSVNQVNTLHAYHPEFRGQGIVISVKEDRFDSIDLDIQGRVVPSDIASGVRSTHATTMATMIAGGGNTFYTGKGVAWGARLSSSNFLNVFPDALSYFQSSGIRVQNHSYGLGIENYYGVEASAYDQQVYQNPELVHIFSAGNMGDSTSQAGQYQGVAGFANLSGNFKMAKNILTVGSVDSIGQVAERSSWGPAYDGRIKPELVAFGEDGSSGAAAIVSGVVAILQEAYEQQFEEQPPVALLRAVLLNSANDIGAPGPDFQSGYGNVNALQAVEAIMEHRFFSGVLMPGMAEGFNIEVPDNAINLKITLAWAGPPAQVNAIRALGNDLDLTLSSISEQWLPWGLSTAPHPDSLALPARRQADHLNNQEQITVERPVGGEYEIRVSTYLLTEGPQEFFLAYQWDTIGHFQWNFPTYLDNARAGERMPVRWESTVDAETAVLEYRLPGAGEWVMIDSEVALDQSFFYWEVPDTLALAQLRMSADGISVVSDTFTISPAMELALGLECADSLLLHWAGIEGADSFQLYALDGNYLEPFTTVTDTFIVIDKKENPTRFYAVAPFAGNSSITGERSPALNLDFQVAGCYIQNFLANLMGEEARLELYLGVSYQVDSLIFEKQQGGQFITLAGFVLDGRLAAEFVDRILEEGLNTYRAVVVLTNGARIFSEEISIFYTGAAYLIFPNPVPVGQGVNILSKDTEEAFLFLYDALGRLLIAYPILSNVEAIPTQNWASGIYFYQIITRGEKQAEGRLLIW